MNITSAQYENDPVSGALNVQIIATIDGENLVVPVDSNNRHYIEISKQVAAGTLTIQDAD